MFIFYFLEDKIEPCPLSLEEPNLLLWNLQELEVKVVLKLLFFENYKKKPYAMICGVLRTPVPGYLNESEMTTRWSTALVTFHLSKGRNSEHTCMSK